MDKFTHLWQYNSSVTKFSAYHLIIVYLNCDMHLCHRNINTEREVFHNQGNTIIIMTAISDHLLYERQFVTQ